MALSSHPICYVSQLLGLPSQRLTVLQRPVQVLSFETGFQHDHSILNARCGSCLIRVIARVQDRKVSGYFVSRSAFLFDLTDVEFFLTTSSQHSLAFCLRLCTP